MARVLTINHLLMGSLWYLLTLWCGSDRDLHVHKMALIDFLWAGQDSSARHRINFRTLALNKKEGGVGLISFEQQVVALSARFIFFALYAGQHPLQLLLQSRIRLLSMHKWGWMITPGRSINAGRCRRLDRISGRSSVVTGIS